MKDYYTIGETAKLLGVSAQALRYYDRENILRPEYINEQTGYRYYTYRQFHIIDRIKYLQGFGLSLEDIGQIIREGTANICCPALPPEKKSCWSRSTRLSSRSRTSTGTSTISPTAV